MSHLLFAHIFNHIKVHALTDNKVCACVCMFYEAVMVRVYNLLFRM